VQYGNGAIPQAELGRYDIIDMSLYRVNDLKAAKDESGGATKVVAYYEPTIAQATCSTTSYPYPNATPAWCGSPVSSQQALAHDQANPGDPWLLRDASGAPYLDPAAPSHSAQYFINPGSASYQAAALGNLRRFLTTGDPPYVIPTGYRYDGVFFDNSDPKLYWRGVPTLYNKGTAVTDAQWHTWFSSFLQNVAGALKGADGLYVMVNAGVANDNQGDDAIAWWNEIHPWVSGVTNEYWLQSADSTKQVMWNWINTPDYRGWFDERFREAGVAHSLGLDFFSLHVGDGTLTDRVEYEHAAFLLGWDGGRHSGFSVFGNNPTVPAAMAWIGTPTEAAQQVGPVDTTLGNIHTNHGWIRHFTGGVVVVNPAEAGQPPITFQLGGSYKTLSGAPVSSSVTLQPKTAMILSR